MKSKTILFKTLLWVTLVATINLLTRCSYYKTDSLSQLNEPQTKEQFNQLLAGNKYFILHSSGHLFHMVGIQVDFESQIVSAQLGEVSSMHQVYIKNEDDKKPPRYKAWKGEEDVLNEVHIYLVNSLLAEHPVLSLGSDTHIPFGSISKVEVVSKDQTRTTASWVFSSLGAAAAIFAVVVIIALATKESCPFVYAKEDSGYKFIGEMYGGANFPQLERDDYMPLQSSAASPVHSIRITNELKESQFINLATLDVVDHTAGTQVYADARGKFYQVKKLQSPITALLDNASDQTSILQLCDNAVCMFNDPNPEMIFQNLTMSFNKSDVSDSGLLVLRLQNSLWLDYIFGELHRSMGSFFNQWKRDQSKVSVDSLHNWAIHQGIHLLVSLQTKNGWQPVEYVMPVGPLASRDVAVPLDLSAVSGNTVNLKLTSGFMFWELDQAGFSDSLLHDFSSYEVTPAYAINEKGENVTGQLAVKDDQYLAQPEIGMVTEVTYQLPALKEGDLYSTFLHSSGWYDPIREFRGLPDRDRLESFKVPGGFTKFSQQCYMHMYPVNLIASGDIKEGSNEHR
ncbi:MAG: hypothetical protein K1X63_01295 [Chitinophagales bacterium]|nr:hypothetical protein [Chitinophagales bacterium]